MSTVTVKRDLLENCKNREYREALNLENVYASVCGQMRNIREQQKLSQAELGRKAKMAQERISILEDPNAETKPTLNTLLRVAGALDVGLEVRFIPFSRVLESSVNISEQQVKVDSFEKELPSIGEKLDLEEAVAKISINAPAVTRFKVGDWAEVCKLSDTTPLDISNLYRISYSEAYLPYLNWYSSLGSNASLETDSEFAGMYEPPKNLIFIDDARESKGMKNARSEWAQLPAKSA